MAEPTPETIREAMTAMRGVGKVLATIQSTVLAGWPHGMDDLPTETEARHIMSIRNEISMHEPDLPADRCWYIAGQCVARCRRDDAAVSL